MSAKSEGEVIASNLAACQIISGRDVERVAKQIDARITPLLEALETRNRDASVLRKLHAADLAPPINIDLIRAEDSADTLLAREPIVHGVNCVKVRHTGSGWEHAGDDDTPYFVDNAKYCGRCHYCIP